MRRSAMISALLVITLVVVTTYFLLPQQDSWCPTQTEDKEIRGEMREVCLSESTYDSGEARIRSWETRDRDYIYQEFYKRNTPQYSITYWDEDGKRCKETKRINNQFVPEGIECTEL